MTLDQIRGTLAAVELEEREAARMALVIARGAQATQTDYRKLLRQLGGK